MAADRAARTPNLALLALREAACLSQQELADELNCLAERRFEKHPNITKKTAGRWERGEVDWPQPFYRRLLAEYFGCASDELGFRRPHRLSLASADPPEGLLTTLVASRVVADPRVEADQRRWRQTRAELGGHRQRLAVAAEQLYPDARFRGLERTGVIAHPAWLPTAPVPLGEIGLVFDKEAAAPAITGQEREAAEVRSLRSAKERYGRYSHAVRDLAAPRLFENRLCFRLLDVDWSSLRFGAMGFFDGVDTNEALAHEMAMHHLVRDAKDQLSVQRPSWRHLTFRKLVGDPFDLARRSLMGAIGTLTIKAGDSPRMILHHRDGERVAGGGSMAHLLPAGIFQPSSVLPEAVAADFSIWRNIQREYAEELLGKPECDGSGQPCDYEHIEPFMTLDQAMRDGSMRVYVLGLILDALTLAGDLLTVAVIEPDLYDDVFRDAVDCNDEGAIEARALPFEGNTIERLRALGQLSPGATAAIHLAWQHRALLFGRVAPTAVHVHPPG